jgi:23S rRNA pseudouridine2457 synthase
VFRYFALYKPFQVLCQFSSEAGKVSLGEWLKLPRDVYPVGRLDYDSEGLLLLTNDKGLTQRLLHPSFSHEREYFVQVEGDIGREALHQLQAGVNIRIDGKVHPAQAMRATRIQEEPDLPPRNPPIRFRKQLPTSWISLVITEGKNRQVRKMAAAVGHPALRLVRCRIGGLQLGNLQPGGLVEFRRDELVKQLFGPAG